jgi:hypothetical protein
VSIYIFVYNEADNSFVERYRVVSPEDDADFLCKSENLTGTVINSEAMAFLETLMEKAKDNASLVTEMVDAPHWQFIEQRFNPAAAEQARTGKPTVF